MVEVGKLDAPGGDVMVSDDIDHARIGWNNVELTEMSLARRFQSATETQSRNGSADH
jgi:hypothetical protein